MFKKLKGKYNQIKQEYKNLKISAKHGSGKIFVTKLDDFAKKPEEEEI
jgi:hypothetical protein